MRPIDRGEVPILTLDDFLGRARNRGVNLWVTTDSTGGVSVTDGSTTPYPLSALAVRRELKAWLVRSLCRHFGLEKFETDFGLDARPDG